MSKFSPEESDDDSLPELFSTVSSTSAQIPVRKSIEQLLRDTTFLSKECQMDLELEATKTILEKPKCSPEITYESNSPCSTDLTKDLELRWFCSNNYLQFFNRDISLQSCGYISKDLTEFERLLLSTAPVKLEHILSTILSICSSNISIHTSIRQVKPFVHYLLKILSVHEKEITVQACERALKSVLDCQSGISFSSSEMFEMLFNYGVNFDDLEVFTYIQPSNLRNCLSIIPTNWTFNMERLLCVIKDLIFALSFSNDDLLQLIKYFLFIHMDTFLKCECLLIVQLKNCLVEALNALSEEKWPSSFSGISKFVLSSEKISPTNQSMDHVYTMTKFIPDSTKRGSELRKYISFSSLKIMSGSDIDTEPSLLSLEYEVSDLMNILSNQTNLIKTLKLNASLSISIKFLDICIQHLKFESEEEFKDLYNCLKNFEEGFMGINESTMEEQEHVLRIRTRLMLMTPDNKSELVTHLHNIKIEPNYDFDQNGPIIHNIKSEIDFDSEQSLSNDMVVSKEPTEIKCEVNSSPPIISHFFEEPINNFGSSDKLLHSVIESSPNDDAEMSIDYEQNPSIDVFVSKEQAKMNEIKSLPPVISDLYEEPISNNFSNSNKLLHSQKEISPNDDAEMSINYEQNPSIDVFVSKEQVKMNEIKSSPSVISDLYEEPISKNFSNSHKLSHSLKENRTNNIEEKENIRKPTIVFTKEKKAPINDPLVIKLVKDKPLNLKTHSKSNNHFKPDVKTASLENKNDSHSKKLATEQTPSLNNLQTHSILKNSSNPGLTISSLGEKETLILEKEDVQDKETKNKNDENEYLKAKLSPQLLYYDDKKSNYSNSLFDDNDDFYPPNFSASSFDHPSARPMDSSIRASVRTSGNDNKINIEINSPQSLDQITDINVRVSTKRNASSEELPHSFPSKQKPGRLQDYTPDVCMIVEDKDKNEVILVSDDDDSDDEIQIVSVNSNCKSNLPKLQKAQTNINKKTNSHPPKNINSPVSATKSSKNVQGLFQNPPKNTKSPVSSTKSPNNVQSLFNFFETTPSKKFKPNDAATVSTPAVNSPVNDVESDIMIIDNLSDDDCKIISEEVLVLD